MNSYNMSLVICANKGEENGDATTSSIFEAYSFRNDLSSTLTIPKNAQVGLHSSKIELDGQLVVGDAKGYQYFGEVLPSTATNMDTSSAYPMEFEFSSIQKESPEELSARLQKVMNNQIWHPNLDGMVSVSAKRDGTTNEWQGFDITYDQDEATASNVPGPLQVYDSNFFGPTGDDASFRLAYPGGSIPDLGWSYTGGTGSTEGVFLVEGHNVAGRGEYCSMIATDYPISLMDGQLKIDLRGALGTGQEFIVGLTRVNASPVSADDYEAKGMFAPTYFNAVRGVDTRQQEVYADIQLTRLPNGTLRLLDVRSNSDPAYDAGTSVNETFFHEVEYWQNANITDFANAYNLVANSLNIEFALFTCNGQQVKIELVDDRGDKKLLYQYDASYTKEQNLAPINQCQWSLVPVLAMKTTPALNGPVNLKITDYTPNRKVNGGKGYAIQDPLQDSAPGWWGEQGDLASEYRGQDIELRPWNDLNGAVSAKLTYMRTPTSGDFRRLGKGTTGDSLFQNLIFVDDEEDSPYDEIDVLGDVGAKLGFNSSPVSVFTEVGSGASAFGVKFSSDAVPSLYGSKSLFIKIGGLSQSSTNAFKGGPSTIIAHQPMFDGQASTGRLYYEPNEIAYLDLNNAYEFKVSSLDIAFCYIDESYATALTGQSVVVLHIRQKM